MAEYIPEERKIVINTIMNKLGLSYEEAVAEVERAADEMRCVVSEAAKSWSDAFRFKMSTLGIVVGNRSYNGLRVLENGVFVEITEKFNGEFFSINENVMDMEAHELFAIYDFMEKQFDIAMDIMENEGCENPRVAWMCAWVRLYGQPGSTDYSGNFAA